MDGGGITLSNLTARKKYITRHNLWLLLLWSPPVLFLAIFYIYPLVSILGLSLGRSAESAAGTFRDVLLSNSTWSILGFTFYQAALSTILTLLIGLPAAYLMAHFRFRGKPLLQALSAVPFVMPTLVVAAAFNALLGPRGWVNLGLMNLFDLNSPPIHFTNTLTAILVAHVFYNTTIVMRTVGDFWAHLDPRLPQAAQVLGATRWQALRLVTLPLLMPVVATAALLVFLFDFTSFAVILILGGPGFATLETEIYYQAISLFDLPTAAVLAIMQLIFTLIMTIFYTRLASRFSRPLSLKPQQFTQRPLDSWGSRLFAGIMIGLLLLLMTAPLAALAARSVTRFETVRGQRGSSFEGFHTRQLS